MNDEQSDPGFLHDLLTSVQDALNLVNLGPALYGDASYFASHERRPAPTWCALIECDGRIAKATERAATTLGLRGEDGESVQLLDLIDSTSRAHMESLLCDSVSYPKRANDVWFNRTDGSRFVAEVCVSLFPYRGRSGHQLVFREAAAPASASRPKDAAHRGARNPRRAAQQ